MKAGEGISVDPKKGSTIEKWERQPTWGEVRGFLGFAVVNLRL